MARAVRVKINADSDRFIEAMRRAADALARMFGHGRGDFSQEWPTCTVDHELYFTEHPTVARDGATEIWTCPGCGAAL